MTRQWLVACAALVALSGTLAACSGSDDEPEASPTKASSATSTTPAPAPTTAPAAAQPQGANGVTWKIQDWQTYQADEAVVEWTHIHEALAASINQGSLVPGLEERTSKSVLRKFVSAVNLSADRGYHVPVEGDVKVLSSTTTGDRAKLTMCMWSTTTGVRDKDDKAVGSDENIWFKQEATLSRSSGQWVLRSFDDTVGTCSGGAPS